MRIVGIAEGADYLGVSKAWLANAPIPRLDYRKPGGVRAVWRWQLDDLDAWLASRRVEPGYSSPLAS